jgi:hypothetical protein
MVLGCESPGVKATFRPFICKPVTLIPTCMQCTYMTWHQRLRACNVHIWQTYISKIISSIISKRITFVSPVTRTASCWFQKPPIGVKGFGIGWHLQPEIGGPMQRHIGCYILHVDCYATTWNDTEGRHCLKKWQPMPKSSTPIGGFGNQNGTAVAWLHSLAVYYMTCL